MPPIIVESYKSDNDMIISNSEYNFTRNQLDRMYKISYALFDAYYGKDYYLPISASDADVYEYLKYLNSKKDTVVRIILEDTKESLTQELLFIKFCSKIKKKYKTINYT